MAETIIIPVQFDTSKSLPSLQPAQAGLNGLAGAGDKLKNSLGGVGSALQNALGGLARGAIIGAATALIASLAQEFLKAGKAANFFGDAVRDATEKSGAEIFTLQALVAVARDETASRESRNNAIEKLQKQYPDYLRNISLETINSDAATAAIDNLTNSIFKKATAQALATKFAEKQLELLDAEKKLNDEIKTASGGNGFFDAFVQNLKGGGGINPLVSGSTNVLVQAANDVKKLKSELAELKTLGIDALRDALNFEKTQKPIKPKELRIEPEKIEVRPPKQGLVELFVPKVEVDADELLFKKFEKGLPQIKERQNGLDGVASGIANANAQIGAGIENATNLGLIISDTLTPSFTGFVDALIAGTDPLKSFFDSMIGAVNQLIDRLIAAALQAAILSALGVGSFGGIFQGILGFGGGTANRIGGGGTGGLNVNVGGEFVMRNGTLVAALNNANTQISQVR